MKLLLFILALSYHHIVLAQIGGYTLINPQEVNTDQSIQDALTLGARYVVEQGIQDNLPDSDYDITRIHSVYKQVVSGLNYKFDIELTNSEGIVVRANYIVYVQSWTDTRKVTLWSYDIQENSNTEGELGEFDFLPEEVYASDNEEEEEEDLGVPGAWSQVDLSDADNDSGIQDLLNYGVQRITEQAALAGQIPDTDYDVDEIHSVYKQVVNGINYQFDVDIKNNLGWTLRATLIVYSQPWNNIRDVTSYTYVYQAPGSSDVSEEEEFVLLDEEDVPGGYFEIDPAEIETGRQLSNALSYGVQSVTGQAVDEHLLPSSDYEVAEVHAIYGQVVSGMNYRFDVSLKNCAGLIARVVFRVYSQVWTDTLEATPISLEITDIPEQGLIGGDCLSDDAENNEEEAAINEEWIDEEEEETGEAAGGFFPIDLEEANNDPQIQELLNFGARYVIAEGIKAHRMPDSNYQVSNVISIEGQVVSGLNYRYNIELQDCHGFTITANYTVYYQSWTNTKEVTESSFDITAAPNGPNIGACPVENEEGEENVEEETQLNLEDSLVGGWNEMPLDQANSDADIQNALAAGIKQFAEQGVQDGNIPDQQYQQDQLISVEEQVVSGMRYKFGVILKGDGGAAVQVNLIVYSQPGTDTLELSSYSIVSVDQ